MAQHRIGMAATGTVLGLLFLAAPLQAQEKPGNLNRALPAVTWDLKALNQPPFKLIKATADPKKNEVRFVVELTRPPSDYELLDWNQEGMAVFRFLDEDGVTIKSVKARREGELVLRAGSRVRLVLPMPAKAIIDATWTIVAD